MLPNRMLEDRMLSDMAIEGLVKTQGAEGNFWLKAQPPTAILLKRFDWLNASYGNYMH